MWTKKKGNEEAESFQDSRRCVGGDEQESRRFRKGGIQMYKKLSQKVFVMMSWEKRCNHNYYKSQVAEKTWWYFNSGYISCLQPL